MLKRMQHQENLTAAERLNERRRCDVVARVLIDGQRAGDGEETLKAKIGQEMRKASAAHEAQVARDEEQRRLGFEPFASGTDKPTPTRRSASRRQTSSEPMTEQGNGPRHGTHDANGQLSGPQFADNEEAGTQQYQPHWSEAAYRSPYQQTYATSPLFNSASAAYGYGVPISGAREPSAYAERARTIDETYLSQYDIRRPSQVFTDGTRGVSLENYR
jgi:hypothetical protein